MVKPKPAHKKAHHKKADRKREKKQQPVVVSNWTPRPPDKPGIGLATAPIASAAAPTSSSSVVPLLLGIALALALLVTAVATIPQRVLHRPVLALVDERRETVLMVGLATAASIALGLLVALLGS